MDATLVSIAHSKGCISFIGVEANTKYWVFDVFFSEILESNLFYSPTWVKKQKEWKTIKSGFGENFCNVLVDYKGNKSCFACTVKDWFSLVFYEKCF